MKLPPDVKAFIADYSQARLGNDVVTMSNLMSDRFLYNGVSKHMALRFVKTTSSYTSETKIIITKFEPEGDEAKIDVWLKDKYFEAPFMIDSKLIKEDGQWKWYGNQISN